MSIDYRAAPLVSLFAAFGFAAAATAASVPNAAITMSGAGGAASVSGTLSGDSDVAFIDFTLGTPGWSEVSIGTLSYAGGTTRGGATVKAGGFDTVVSLFDWTGGLIDYNDDNSTRADPLTQLRSDSRLDLALKAGAYTIAISQFYNFPANGLDEGFTMSAPDFTAEYGCSNGRFCDTTGANRTGDYALEVNVAPVPVPAALPMLGSALGALGALGLFRRRRAA